MRKYICDHCGKRITNMDDYIEYDIEFEGDEFGCDLCAKCKEEIVTKVREEIEQFIEVYQE